MHVLSRSEENRQLLRGLDFSHLALLARRLVSEGVRLALLSDEKKYIWAQDEAISLALGSLGEDPNFSMMSIDQPHRFVFADQALLELPLLSKQPEPFALLYLYGDGHCLAEAFKRADGIDLLTKHIVTEFEQRQNIKYLTDDLNSRSEELHMVMNIQDSHASSEGWLSVTLTDLREFDETLEFGMCAALFTCYQDTPHVSTWQRQSSEETAILNALRDEVLPWVVSNNQSIIVNQAGDSFQSDVSPSLPFKLMVTPLNDSQDRVIGVMVTLNAYHDRDFTAAHQNLQDVVAHRIASEYERYHDPLTGLLNREGFNRYVEDLHHEVALNNSEHTLLRLDVDRINPLQKLVGHKAGVEVLQLVAKAINGHIRVHDRAARIQGNVFYCALEYCPIDEGEVIANRILREVRGQDLRVGEQSYPVTVSIGATAINTGTDTVKTAITAAEVACEAAKEAGRDRLRVFTQGNIDLIRRENDFECINLIQRALQYERFALFAQQIFHLHSDEPYQHYELLIRMHDDDGNVINPDQFLPVAERYMMMPMIDSWILRHALKSISQLESTPEHPSPVWNLNISGNTIGDEMFQAELEAALETYNVDPACICLEIKETNATNHIQQSRQFLEHLRERGVLLALDDFGTGATSFSYLQNIDVDHLKIDGSFVRRIATDKIAATIVSSIQKVAHSMNIRTVAEKVEDDTTIALARSMGIDMAQGYGLHKPQPLKEIIEQIQQDRGSPNHAMGSSTADKDQTVTEAQNAS